jgi:hypothetical protein
MHPSIRTKGWQALDFATAELYVIGLDLDTSPNQETGGYRSTLSFPHTFVASVCNCMHMFGTCAQTHGRWVAQIDRFSTAQRPELVGVISGQNVCTGDRF